MSLTPEQAAKLDSTLTNCSEVASLAERLVTVFQSGGVQNPDLAVLQSQLETYASNANNISSGVLGTANGGTGRNDGMVTNLYDAVTGKSLLETGQIGNVINLSSISDLFDVNYNARFVTSGTEAHGAGLPVMVTTNKRDATTTDYIMNGSGIIAERYRKSSATSGAMQILSGCFVGIKNIYIDTENGDDLNSGLISSQPIKTVNQLYNILSAYHITILRLKIKGTLSELTVSNFAAKVIFITNFEDSANSPQSIIDTLKVEGSRAILYNIKVTGYLECVNGVADIRANCSVGHFSVYNSGDVIINNDLNVAATANGALFSVNRCSAVEIMPNVVFNGSGTYPKFISIYNSSVFICSNSVTFNVNATDLGTIHGAAFEGKDPLTFPHTTTNAVSDYSLGCIPQSGVVLTSGNQEINNCGNFILNNSYSMSFSTKHSGLERGGSLPSNTKHGGFYCADKNGSAVSFIQSSVDNQGNTATSIGAANYSNTNSDYARLSLVYRDSGLKDAWFGADEVRSGTDNVTSLGDATYRWTQLYAATATISTSDERVKTSINNIPDTVLDAWEEVNFQQYQFVDAVKEKGSNARLHTGAIAQAILNAFSKHNLDATKYGLLCHDSWDASDETVVDKEAVTETITVIDKKAVYETVTVVDIPEYTDEEGNVIPAVTHTEEVLVSPEESHTEEKVIEPEVTHVEHRDAGDLYSLRYEELFAVEAAYQRRRADRLEARIEALEKKIK